MPATDFSQYLGMPQQAPAQSFFESVRPSGPSYEEERQMIGEGRRQLRDLRRMAPIFQAQQAQLAYDQVAEQARQLRQKQEIEAQVQRATEEITQGAIDPESDQFNQQALQFYGRNQLAFLDPRMKEAMSFLSNQNQQYQAARSAMAQADMKTQEDTRRRYLSALEGGELMPQEIPAGATQEQIAFLQGRAKKRKEETELERKQREAAEQDRKSAMSWAGKRGVPTDLVNLMPDSASIYQLGSAYGGARGTSATGGPVIKFYENKLQALKAQADALSAKAEETDDDKVRETLQKQALDASQQFIDTNAEFIKKLDELNVTGGGAAAGAAPAFTLPNYPYSREFRAGFEAAAGGVPAAVGGQFTVPGLAPPPADGGAAPAPTAQVQPPPSPTQQIDLDTQLAAIPFAQQREFLERAKIAKAEQEAIAPAWTKAKTEIGDLIKKVVPDKPLPGTKVNELESFARAVLNPNENIIQHPEYGSIPVAWDILNKAGVPMAEIMTNATVFRQPGEGRRMLGFIGTQQVGYQELLRQWAKDFLNERGTLSPSPVAKEIPLNTRSKALGNVMKAIETDQTVK